jgi:hypothetical protein
MIKSEPSGNTKAETQKRKHKTAGLRRNPDDPGWAAGRRLSSRREPKVSARWRFRRA